jgi:ribonuclease P protein component
MGISVSKKIGKSVVRNKAKRRIGEAFCRLAPYLVRPYNYVAVAREGIGESTFTEIIETLESLLKQAHHIPKESSWKPIEDEAKEDLLETPENK